MFEALSHSSLAALIASLPYYKLVLETAHIVAGLLGVGAVGVLAVRVLGVAKDIPVEPLARATFRLAWSAFAVLLLAGVLQFIPLAGDAPDAGPERNPIGIAYRWWFQAKMAAVVVALAHLLWLYANVRRHARDWDSTGAVPRSSRYAALVLVVALPAIFVFARMMFAFLQATGVNSR
jgi:hypothetical protein